MAKKKGKRKKMIMESAVDPEVEEVFDSSAGTGVKKKQEDPGDTDDLLSEIDTNLRIAVDRQRPWAEIAEEDINFALGKQWDDEDIAILEQQKRPCMTFNKIKPIVQLVAGHLIQNQARIEVKPEGGEDQNFSAVMDRILDHIDKLAKLKFKLSYLFAGGERAGRTWVEFYMDYDEDPIFGRLKVNYLGAFKVFMDPNGEEYDLSDRMYGCKVMKMAKSRIKQLFPDKEDEIDGIEGDPMAHFIADLPIAVEGDENNYGNDETKSKIGLNETGGETELTGDLKQITVCEYWKKEIVERWYCYNSIDGSVKEYDTEEEATDQEQKLMQSFAQRGEEGRIVKRKRKVARMKFAVKAGDVLCTNGLEDSPFEPLYHGFPWFQYICEWAPEARDEEYKIQSVVRSLKDPQREVNKSRSQYLHILNTSANSGWIGDEDALTPAKWSELQQFGSTPGITIRKKRGTQLERIHPVEPSLAQQVREKSATDDFKEVSGINADLLAVDSKASPSGKAIALRMRQAITILQPSFENFRYTKELIGQFLFRIVPNMFDEVRVEKIVGQKFMQERGLDRNAIRVYLSQVEDGKYDVEITDAGSPDTLREETFEDLMMLIEKGMPLPPDLILEFMNIPNKAEAMNRVKEYQAQQQQAAMAMEQMKQAPKR